MSSRESALDDSSKIKQEVAPAIPEKQESPLTSDDYEKAERFEVTPEFARDVRLQHEKEEAERHAFEATPEGQDKVHAEALQEDQETTARRAKWAEEQANGDSGYVYNIFTDSVEYDHEPDAKWLAYMERTRPAREEEARERNAAALVWKAEQDKIDAADKVRKAAVEQLRKAEEEMSKLHTEAKRLNRLLDKGLTPASAEELGRQKAAESRAEQ